MKIALLNDTHFGARNDSLIFDDYFFKFYENTNGSPLTAVYPNAHANAI